MQINESITNMESIWFQQKSNSANTETKQIEKIISEKNKTENLNEEHDFRTLCKRFPNISFVVVDEIGELQSEYKGICNTSAFGDFGQISIAIDKEVIENIDNDWDNIVKMIQGVSSHYNEIVGHVKATSACSYTMVTIHYASAGNCLGLGGLSYTQSLWFDPPTYYREFGEDAELGNDLGINERYLQAFLMKIQVDVFDKLFEIGEGKQEHKMKTASKVVEEYQEHFIYEKGGI